MSASPTAEWTVMVFLNAKNNLEEFSFLNFEQMAKVGSTDDVNILVEFGRPQQHYTQENTFGDWSKTLRFQVTEGMTPTEKNAVLDLGAVNMGDGAALADFVEWSRENYPAKRYMLALWDHGQGWRRRSAVTVRHAARGAVALSRAAALADVGDQLGSMAPLPEDLRVTGSFKYVSHDEDTGDKLYNREIQDALKPLIRAGKIDLIGFDACLMSMLETGYALRRLGSVMVGSEELEPGDGWSYDNFLRPLVAKPNVSAAELGRLMVHGYREYYGNRDATTLSAVSLRKMSSVAGALSSFAEVARASLDTQRPIIKKARSRCANYAPGYGLNSIDLIRFLDNVSAIDGVDDELAAAAKTAAKAARGAVIENYASTMRQGKFGSNGIAIYFPATREDFNNDPDRDGYLEGNTLYPVEFVQRQEWASFLRDYLKL